MSVYNKLLYNESFTICYGYANEGEPEKIVLHENTRVITPSAFLNNKSIKEIVFNEKIELIDNSAFEESSIEKVHIPDTVTLSTRSFALCENLEEVILDTLDIPRDCFLGSHIKNITINSRAIDEYAFHHAKFDNISLSKNVVKLDDCAFYNCTFENDTLILPNSITSIGDLCFAFSNLKYVYLPKDVNMLPAMLAEPFGSEIIFYVPESLIKKHKDLDPFINNIKILNIDTLLEEHKSFKEINEIKKITEYEI